MQLSDLKTKEAAAYQLVQAQRRLAAAQEDCRALEQWMMELENEEQKTNKEPEES